MTDREDFRVKRPYLPTQIERNTISELKDRGLKAGDWESRKSGIVSFKEHILEHMYYEQNFRCAYCRIEQSSACSFLQREHIVPKSLHPEWMFEPINICFTCERCNNSKGNTEVLDNPVASVYPTRSSDFKIVNPFIDKYSDHIELKEDLIYVGKTPKGIFTIKKCKLHSPEYALDRAKRKMEDSSNPDIIKDQVLRLLSTHQKIDDEAMNEVKRKVEKIVSVYKRQ